MGDCAARSLQILTPIQLRDGQRGKGDWRDNGEVGRCYGMMEGFGDLGDLRIDGQG